MDSFGHDLWGYAPRPAGEGLVAGFGLLLLRGREERGRAGSWVSGGMRFSADRARWLRAGRDAREQRAGNDAKGLRPLGPLYDSIRHLDGGNILGYLYL